MKRTMILRIIPYILSSLGLIISFSSISEDNLVETNHLVKAGDKFVTLIGKQISVGDEAPDFKVVDANFSPVTLSSFQGKVVLISAVPSLDTGVCSLQTQRFNTEASSLSEDLVIVTISNDLPFAQSRFCKQEKISNIKVLSDSVWRDFSKQYGLLIKDMGLLTRAVIIIDENSRVIYKELVPNISTLPNMDAALSKLKTLKSIN